MNPTYTSFNGYLGGPIGSIIGAILNFYHWLACGPGHCCTGTRRAV